MCTMMSRGVFLLLCLFCAVKTVFAAAPSQFELSAAIAEYLKNTADPSLRPFPVLKDLRTCFPAHKQPEGTFVCITDIEMLIEGKLGVRKQELGVRKTAEGWVIKNPAAESLRPACPSLGEAEAELRKHQHDDRIVVRKEVSDGEGVLSEERGKFRERKGPLRLMCSYEAKADGQEILFVAYVWYARDRYTIEEVERWAD